MAASEYAISLASHRRLLVIIVTVVGDTYQTKRVQRDPLIGEP